MNENHMSDNKIYEARIKWATGKYLIYSELAKEYNVSTKYIRSILLGIIRSDVPGPLLKVGHGNIRAIFGMSTLIYKRFK